MIKSVSVCVLLWLIDHDQSINHELLNLSIDPSISVVWLSIHPAKHPSVCPFINLSVVHFVNRWTRIWKLANIWRFCWPTFPLFPHLVATWYGSIWLDRSINLLNKNPRACVSWVLRYLGQYMSNMFVSSTFQTLAIAWNVKFNWQVQHLEYRQMMS